MRRLKILLLLVLLLALPLRGLAAAAMWCCSQDAGSATSSSHHESSQAQAHSHDGHSHGDSGEESAHARADAMGHGEAVHDHQVAESSCGGCAAGCTSAVALTSWPTFTFASPGTIRIPFFEPRVTAFVPPGLDRPPLS